MTLKWNEHLLNPSQQHILISCSWRTGGARRVDVQRGALDADVGSEVAGQRQVGGPGDLVGQRVDALDAAAVGHEVHADALLSQRRQHLLQGPLQLCKQERRSGSWLCVGSAALRNAARVGFTFPHSPLGHEHMLQETPHMCISLR